MKIAVCTPYHAQVAAEYAGSLASMLLFTARANIVYNGIAVSPDFQLFYRRGSVLPRCRNELAKDALDWGADYLLWIDGDHLFPEHALIRLLSLNLPVVGANYARRAKPTSPTATSLGGDLIWTTEDLASRGEVVQVSNLGLGFCLVEMNVIRSLWEMPGPLFAFEMLGRGLEAVGEDVFFFRRVREAGFGVYLDHQLSWDIGHVHDRIVTNADALRERPAD